MSIYFDSDPTNPVIDFEYDTSYTIYYKNTDVTRTIFWFELSNSPGSGVVVGSDGPTNFDTRANNWNMIQYNNKADWDPITNIVSDTFYYSGVKTKERFNNNAYDPSLFSRFLTVYGMTSNYSVKELFSKQLGAQDIWGIVGDFNSWGSDDLDIPLIETATASKIFTATLDYEILKDKSFKFRSNNSWDKNYGSSTTNWTQGALVEGGDNITPTNVTMDYKVTFNLNDSTYMIEKIPGTTYVEPPNILYFNSDPTNPVIDFEYDTSYTISYKNTDPRFKNFWFELSNYFPGLGVIVGPDGPSAEDPSGNWCKKDEYGNHAEILDYVASTTFYYPENKTKNYFSQNNYDPKSSIRFLNVYGANSSYDKIDVVLTKELQYGSWGNWGIIGIFNGWGDTADINMTETYSGSHIFTAKLPKDIFSGTQFKFRHTDENWDMLLGIPTATTNSWNTGKLTLYDAETIRVPELLVDYTITLDLRDINNVLYSATEAYAPCFHEDSTILSSIEGVETYVPVKNLRQGDLVKTYKHGYLPITAIRNFNFYNCATNPYKLHKLIPEKFPALTSELIVTGAHSLLVDSLEEKQKRKCVAVFGSVKKIDDKYRLPAGMISEKYENDGLFNIWHFALDSVDNPTAYGVYANGGLLVETTISKLLLFANNANDI